MEKENLMTDEEFVMTGEELAELCGLGNLYRKGKEQQLEEETKKIINENLSKSSMYGGLNDITGVARVNPNN